MKRDMSVIRQILSKIAHSTQRVVLVESLGDFENLGFHLNLLQEELYIKPLISRSQPNHDPYVNNQPDSVQMTWKGYDLLDKLSSEHQIWLKSQGL